jgi:TRAP-type mannitol/chloroaromatic compound transport system substrate-binding protein
MNRRTFLFTGVLGGVPLLAKWQLPFSLPFAAAPTKTGQTSKPGRMRWTLYASNYDSVEIYDGLARHFAGRVADLSGGEMSVDVVKCRSMGGSEPWQRVCAGSADMAFGSAYHWRLPADSHRHFGHVPFGMGTRRLSAWLKDGGGQILWDEVYGQYGLKVLPCGEVGAWSGFWMREPVASIADFNGRRMFLRNNFTADTFRRLGVADRDDDFTAISRLFDGGELDGTEGISLYHDLQWNLHGLAQHYYSGERLKPGYFLELAVSRPAWEKLPARLRGAVAAAAAQTSRFSYTRNLMLLKNSLPENAVFSRHRLPERVNAKMRHAAFAARLQWAEKSELNERIFNSYERFNRQA